MTQTKTIMKTIKSILLLCLSLTMISCGGPKSGPAMKVLSSKKYAEVVNKYYFVDSDFVDGVCIVATEEFYGLINAKGEEIVPCQYKDLDIAGEGLIIFENRTKDENGWTIYSYGYLNNKGEEVVPAIYNPAGAFCDGLAVVAKKNAKGDRKYGYINNKGEEVIPLVYDRAYSFAEGLAVVLNGNKEYAINTNNDIIITLDKKSEFLEEEFAHGLIPVITEGKRSYSVLFYNAKGEVAFTDTYLYATGFDEEGLAMVLTKSKEIVYINTKGEVQANRPSESEIEDFLDEADWFVSDDIIETLMDLFDLW